MYRRPGCVPDFDFHTADGVRCTLLVFFKMSEVRLCHPESPYNSGWPLAKPMMLPHAMTYVSPVKIPPAVNNVRRAFSRAWTCPGLMDTPKRAKVSGEGSERWIERIVKTIYILRYIHEEERRQRVQLQLNRGESRHALVTCAVAIQTELKAENAQSPSNRRMQFRTGVNFGDVMVEGEQIYGDGVNVAARLESLAEPGGICISDVVHGQVRTKLSLRYQDLGQQRVKDIAEPVRVLRVLTDGAIPSEPRRESRWFATSYASGRYRRVARGRDHLRRGQMDADRPTGC
jgi:Tn3 transposase DDE domain/Adenylate and Guanylate cyclase catalytic domain